MPTLLQSESFALEQDHPVVAIGFGSTDFVAALTVNAQAFNAMVQNEGK